MDADGNIWAVVPVKETPPRSNVWQGCWLQARAGNWRSRCSRTFSRPLLACPNWPASSRSPSTPTLPTSLCAPASRHGARRIAMVTPARSWPRTCRSRTAKKFEIDKPRDAYDRHRRLRNRPGREVWLELDDGKQVHLRPHDVVVQNGTRHAWRNKRDRPVKMAFVLIGARRNA